MSDVDEIKKELESGSAQILDVREQQEWDEGHLKLAILVPLSNLQSGESPDGLDKSKKTYVHCRSGNRVKQAAPILTSMGFTSIVPMSQGFDELVDLGFEPEYD